MLMGCMSVRMDTEKAPLKMGSKNSGQFWEKIVRRSLKRGSSDTECITCDFTPFGAVLTHLDISVADAPKIKRYAYLEIDPALTDAEKKNAYMGFIAANGAKKFPKIMISLTEGMTFRQLSLPEMPHEDLMKAFAWELKKKFFFNPEDNHLGFIEAMEVDGVEGIEKLYDIYYCEKKAVDAPLDFVQMLALEIQAVIPGQAVLAAYANKVEPTPDQDVIVCEVFETVARIIVVQSGKNMLFRNVILGQVGAGVTDAILEKIAQEIQVTTDYYESQKHSRPIGKILFTGGGYDVVHLHEVMSQKLPTKIVLPNLDPFLSDGIDKESREFILSHPGLFGSALGLPLVVEQTINLVPEDVKTKNQFKKNNYILNLGLIGLGLIFAGIIGLSILNIQWMKSQLVDLQNQYSEITSRKEILQSMLADSRVRRTARTGNIPVRALLKEISLRTPALAVLSEVQYNRQDGALKIVGEVAPDAKRDNMKTVTQYVASMSESTFCSAAKLANSSQDNPDSPLKFEIVCDIKGFS